MRVLVVDDELPMRLALVETLKSEGYRVSSAGDGEAALEMAFASDYDLILLDVMMPKIDGFAACAELRKRGCKAPVLMLTARGMVDDRVQGLDCGADDYLVKPFSLKELLARVRALLRRKERGEIPQKVTIGSAEVDFRNRTCLLNGEKQELNAKECGMLQLLLKCRGEVVSRDRFLDEVWEYHANPTVRTVDNYIAELRKKLGETGPQPRLLLTVRGEGYQLVDDQIV